MDIVRSNTPAIKLAPTYFDDSDPYYNISDDTYDESRDLVIVEVFNRNVYKYSKKTEKKEEE